MSRSIVTYYINWVTILLGHTVELTINIRSHVENSCLTGSISSRYQREFLHFHNTFLHRFIHFFRTFFCLRLTNCGFSCRLLASAFFGHVAFYRLQNVKSTNQTISKLILYVQFHKDVDSVYRVFNTFCPRSLVHFKI